MLSWSVNNGWLLSTVPLTHGFRKSCPFSFESVLAFQALLLRPQPTTSVPPLNTAQLCISVRWVHRLFFVEAAGLRARERYARLFGIPGVDTAFASL